MKNLGSVFNTESHFYQKGTQYKKFAEVTEETIEGVINYANTKLGQLGIPIENKGGRTTKLDRYLTMLRLMTHPFIHEELATYDERVLFLIYTLDPELTAYNTLRNTRFTKQTAIEYEKDPKKKKLLSDKRKVEHEICREQIRDKIGFFNQKFIGYEQDYARKFVKDESLAPIPRKPCSVEFTQLLRSHRTNDFSNTTLERYNELHEKALKYKYLFQDNFAIDTLMYNIYYEKEKLGLTTPEEQVIFFVAVLDPDLDVLRIHTDGNRTPVIEEECKKTVGYYSLTLVKIEANYHDRFMKDIKLTDWEY